MIKPIAVMVLLIASSLAVASIIEALFFPVEAYSVADPSAYFAEYGVFNE